MHRYEMTKRDHPDGAPRHPFPPLSDDDNQSSRIQITSSEAFELNEMLQGNGSKKVIQMQAGSELSSDTKIGGDGTVAMNATSSPDPDKVEELVATEMKGLTLDERKAVYEDIHGVAAVETETPEAIEKLMEEFRDAIRKVRIKPELEKALFLNPDYVMDPKSILMFLRAEDYDVKEAAQRMTRHYKHKLELFGIERLARPILFEDLMAEDQDAALTCFYQKLALPDQSGRTVLVTLPHLLRFKAAVNQVCLQGCWISITPCTDAHQERARSLCPLLCSCIVCTSLRFGLCGIF